MKDNSQGDYNAPQPNASSLSANPVQTVNGAVPNPTPQYQAPQYQAPGSTTPEPQLEAANTTAASTSARGKRKRLPTYLSVIIAVAVPLVQIMLLNLLLLNRRAFSGDVGFILFWGNVAFPYVGGIVMLFLYRYRVLGILTVILTLVADIIYVNMLFSTV